MPDISRIRNLLPAVCCPAHPGGVLRPCEAPGCRDWCPARLVHGDIIALTVTLVAQASIRAYDYGTGADETGGSRAGGAGRAFVGGR